jgi:FixJ family two-component response regulator
MHVVAVHSSIPLEHTVMGGSVCVIDDDDEMREVLSRVVRSAGLTPELYDSAESFLRRRENSPIACMLVDVQLGGLNGVALLEHLAKSGCDCPFFLISGAHDAVSADTAKRLGAVIIDKPFNVRLLAQRIRTAVSATDR